MRIIAFLLLCTMLAACAPQVVAPDDEGKSASTPRNKKVYEQK